ncbi:NUDIX domain-containing protein [Tumebacillus permanentifrigoris]|uniref:8-oxo-dGTPase n=1 Tax=Tumebacillus permanentifrigoris TaxID=378543 RepID=A0A316D722_9BACL|nr:NUDIX domain-containing protein [Tumebacillus permanentifrigoris]PWK11335.1 8-oxo-dGTPase [Tumebacillus permanentifrigoris]
MKYEFDGAYSGQRVTLTFEEREFVDPGFVLVFAFYQGKLLLTRNKRRGWEVPGGTREPHEWPIQTAVREVYEETGAELAALEPLGQYTVEMEGTPPFVKSIYVARVARLHELPSGFETDEVRLFAEPPTVEEVRAGVEFSPILKDDVYPLALERLRGHRFSKKEQ